MTLRLAPMIGLLAALAPALAHAQTDIDQGKTPAQIFATDCATCHKAARGLAKGRSSAALASFLEEHYTTNGDQAAALAAYVLGAGRGGAAAAQGHGQKPAAEHARAPAAEPRSEEHQAGEHQARQRPAAESHESRTAITGRGRRPHLEPVPTAEPEPAVTVIHEPSAQPAAEPAATIAHEPSAAPAGEPGATETPAKDVAPTPSVEAPQNSAAGENTPVPRDNIPD